MDGAASDDLLDLIELVYDVALSDDGWDPILERVADLFGGVATVFFVEDRVANEVGFARLWGLPDESLHQFQSHFAPLDPGFAWLETQLPGTLMTDESLPTADYQGSEFMNDFRRPWGVERFMAAEIFRDPRRRSILGVQAPWSRKPFDRADLDQIRRIVPHLRKATQLATHVGRDSRLADSMEEIIERLPMGVVILGEKGEVLHANEAARAIGRAGDGLEIRSRGLRATLDAPRRRLDTAIAGALELAARSVAASAGAFPVPRPSGGLPYTVLVTPGPGKASHSPLRVASAIVLIGDAEAQLRSGATVVADLYGLTPAEARLAHALASGDSLAGYAARAGITESTARSTLKQVRAKTGTRRQAELVRLLWTGPASVFPEGESEA